MASFSGYRWTYFTSLPQGSPLRVRAESFVDSVDWRALQEYTSGRREGTGCRLLSDIGHGLNHMVRILEFDDGLRWVARLRLPALEGSISSTSLEMMEICEYSTISLVQQTTTIPVPIIHALEVRSDNTVKAPFMLMHCIAGNTGMDLGMQIPPQHKQAFMHGLAQIHVQLSTIQLPKIGAVLGKNTDGTYEQGPMPGLGGPFDTATAFFQAWAAKIKFGLSDKQLRAASGPYADEIVASVASFPESISKLAGRLSALDHGPFPLLHGDFGHNNILVDNDDDYRILAVIDWEGAFAAPWELFADFPLTFAAVPPAMDAPWNYDAQGCPRIPS